MPWDEENIDRFLEVANRAGLSSGFVPSFKKELTGRAGWRHKFKKFDTIGIDLVAMCVNDLIVQGAKPLFFLDYIAVGKLNLNKTKRIINGIFKGCNISKCKLIGGETAEMPGVYSKDKFDLAGFSVGIVSKKKILS